MPKRSVAGKDRNSVPPSIATTGLRFNRLSKVGWDERSDSRRETLGWHRPEGYARIRFYFPQPAKTNPYISAFVPPATATVIAGLPKPNVAPLRLEIKFRRPAIAQQLRTTSGSVLPAIATARAGLRFLQLSTVGWDELAIPGAKR